MHQVQVNVFLPSLSSDNARNFTNEYHRAWSMVHAWSEDVPKSLWGTLVSGTVCSRELCVPETFRSRELSFPLFRSGPYIPRTGHTGPCMNHALAILSTRPYTVYMAVLYTKQGAVRLSKMLMKACKYNWTCASFGLLESTTQTADRPVQLFLHSSLQEVPILDNRRLYQNCPFPWGICPPI